MQALRHALAFFLLPLALPRRPSTTRRRHSTGRISGVQLLISRAQAQVPACVCASHKQLEQRVLFMREASPPPRARLSWLLLEVPSLILSKPLASPPSVEQNPVCSLLTLPPTYTMSTPALGCGGSTRLHQCNTSSFVCIFFLFPLPSPLFPFLHHPQARMP